ncbi:polysaccharide biosynthesis/export protein [Gammaproteobacteria bacterium]
MPNSQQPAWGVPATSRPPTSVWGVAPPVPPSQQPSWGMPPQQPGTWGTSPQQPGTWGTSPQQPGTWGTPPQQPGTVPAATPQQPALGTVPSVAPAQPGTPQVPGVQPPPPSGQLSPIEKQIQAPNRNPNLDEQKVQAAPELLKQFGYDLFAGVPTTFAPANDIPVPTDYVIGPSDTIQIQLFGKDNVSYSLPVSRDGTLNFPGIGPIPVAGKKFSDMRDGLVERITHQMIGNKVDITMGALRSIRVLILGEAQQPGSYTISALSTVTNALVVSGGIKSVGSLRNIQVKRGGQNLQTLDLYDLLINGDTSSDIRLASGDALFIPPIGPTVGVGGAVHRPAIYELKGEKRVSDVIKLAGGALPSAYLQGSQLERIHEGKDRTVINMDLRKSAVLASPVQDGDVVRIYSVLDRFDSAVMLTGNVYRPGQVQWRRDMRLTDLIPSVKDLLPRSDTHYVVIQRQQLADRHFEVLSADLGLALANPKSAANIRLAPMDEVHVFGLDEDRVLLLSTLITQLRQQTGANQPEPIVAINGQVRNPGPYPFEKGMRLTGLIRAAVGTLPNADLSVAIVRRELDNGQHIEGLSARLREALAHPGEGEDLLLHPRDHVYIFGLDEDRHPVLDPMMTDLRNQAQTKEEAQVVDVSGSIRKPGSYPLNRGMRVSDLVRVAGNLSDAAYTLSAEITRYEVINSLSRETDHLTVNLAGALNGDPKADLPLKSYDRLNIRPVPSWGLQETVEVVGEVRFPGVYSISLGESLTSLLRRVGGLTPSAFPIGAVFTREDLRVREQQQIDELASRMEADLATSQLEQTQPTAATAAGTGAASQQAVAIGRQLVQQLRSTKAAGRLVIDLPALLAGREISGLDKERYNEMDIVLKNGDRLVVPRETQEVTVIGEVYHPTSHVYQKNDDRNDYVERSGGLTVKADEKRIYIVQANGNVVANNTGSLLGFLPGLRTVGVHPGDTIVVPLDAERVQPLAFWSEISKIIYEIGLSAAAFRAVGAL